MDSGWWFIFAIFNAVWCLLFIWNSQADGRLHRAVVEQLGDVSAQADKARHDVQQLAFVVRLQQDQLNKHAELMEQHTKVGV